jgi:3-deoxy-D-manno-octulosonate 8-phosphate phosphatase (KDO 8-P phosphatase)
LPDLPVLQQCGFAVAVANAVDEVKAAAHYVTKAAGGRGAVREFSELVLRAQGQLGTARAV